MSDDNITRSLLSSEFSEATQNIKTAFQTSVVSIFLQAHKELSFYFLFGNKLVHPCVENPNTKTEFLAVAECSYCAVHDFIRLALPV